MGDYTICCTSQGKTKRKIKKVSKRDRQTMRGHGAGKGECEKRAENRRESTRREIIHLHTTGDKNIRSNSSETGKKLIRRDGENKEPGWANEMQERLVSGGRKRGRGGGRSKDLQRRIEDAELYTKLKSRDW